MVKNSVYSVVNKKTSINLFKTCYCMSKSSSSRSVWSLVLKIIITVATAIGGVFGVQSCM